jgi:hypothetical protein
MPSIINAATSGGLISTADTSGVLQLQTASTAALTVSATQQVQVNTGGSAAAPVISKSDDINTGIFFPAADTIAFAEGGTESMRIDSSGNLLVGTTTPLANEKFNVTSGTNAITGLISATNASQSNDIFRINSARNTTDGTYNSFSVYNTGSSAYKFVLTDGGNISTFGGQITFPATQNASSNANTLDDYEEGTWTPSYFADGTAGTTTYGAQAGSYVKIGNSVWLEIYLSWSGQTGTGNGVIGNLPFTPNSYSPDSRGFVAVFAYGGISYTGGYYEILNTSSSYLELYTNNGGTIASAPKATVGQIRLQCFYRTAS